MIGDPINPPWNIRKTATTAWAFVVLAGGIFVSVALGMSDPIEPEDWLLIGVFSVFFVVLPILFCFVASLTKSTKRSTLLLVAALAWAALLFGIIRYG